MQQVKKWIGEALGADEDASVDALEQWMSAAGLPDLHRLIDAPVDADAIAAASAMSSSMKGNPVTIPQARLAEMIAKAFL